MRVEEASSTEELLVLRDEWEELQAASAPSNVFLTFEWALAWWRHLGAGRRLRVILERDEHGPRAILPLVEGPLWRRGPFRRLQLLGTGLSDRLDWMLRGEPGPSVERSLLRLLARPVSWDALELRDVPEGSCTVDALPTACARLGLRCEVGPDSESPFLPIESDWETFFASRFGRERRQQIRRKERRLAGRSPVFNVIDSAPDGGATALERLRAVRQHASYRGEERASIFNSEAKRAFFAEVAESFSRRGWLRAAVLDIDGQPAAFRFSFEYAGTYFDYYHGFDQGFDALSPGQVLLAHTMEECFRRGLREVDFLRGDEPWKAVWTDRRRKHVRIRVFRPGVRGAIVRLLLAVNDRRRARSSRVASPKPPSAS